MTFALSDVQKLANPTTFARGMQYFTSGKVLSVREIEDEIVGTVSGSERQPYSVSIYDEGDWLDTSCSCPVGADCKHVVAVLLKVIQNRQKQGPQAKPAVPKRAIDPLETWLTELDGHKPQQHRAPRVGNYYLIYALHLSAKGAAIQLYKAYLKKNGEWGQIKPTQVDMYTLMYHTNSHIQDEDNDILRLLMGQKHQSSYVLEKSAGGLLLAAMLGTSRLAYMAADKALHHLKPGPDLPLTMQWQANNGSQKLHLSLPNGEQWQLIPTEPPYYLNTANDTLGLLIADLSGAQLAKLATMPPVPDSAMTNVAVRLRSSFTRAQLPLPQEPNVTVVDTPTPHLTLVVSTGSDGVRFPGALLHWHYGEIDLPYTRENPDQTVFTQEHNGRHYQVKRDLDVELAQIKLLAAQNMGVLAEFPPWRDAWTTKNATGQQSIAEWRRFENVTIPMLREQGWQIDLHPDYRLDIKTVSTSLIIRDTTNHWFDLALDFEVDGRRLQSSELVAEWLRQGAADLLLIPVADGTWIEVDTAPLRPLRDLLLELLNQNKLDKPATLAPFQAARLLNTDGLNADRAPLTRKLIKALENFSGLTDIAPPASLNATLRDYQRLGLNWLVFLRTYGFGGVLADDMGLGKTLQALAFILHLKEKGQLKKPVLVVAPTSLMGNWAREAENFAPSLRVTRIHGPDRGDLFKLIKKSDLVLTTYPLLLRDADKYKSHTFSVLVLDEAQYIKNSQTKIAQQVRQLKSETRLCLTGTPLENHLGELWSLMDFALPGLLGNRDYFRTYFRNPIENEGNGERQTELGKRVAPFMLRRVKADVAGELPPKTEIIHYIELEGGQRQLYESIRVTMEKRIRELIQKQGFARSQIEFLDALLKLRQACIDPRLVKLDKAQNIHEHAKLDWLAENLPQLLEEGRSILVFSLFTQALGLIEAKMDELKIPYVKLTGQTRKRDEAINKFQSGEVRLFLISLKAGGSGLNLTAADVVIHVDPWWNPAVENQATDRAHRIGQDKPVFVYKLVAANTIEEKIQDMQRQKQALADALFDETNAVGLPDNKDALLALLS